MAEKIQAVRGTQDLLGDVSRQFRYLDATCWEAAKRYNYEEIRTPVFEFSEVFHRTLGDTSDIVSKETYTFADRGGESLTLRPEGTAGIARAFLSNGLAQHLPLKYYYFGPMFRYERPQKGRYRQFHQIGVECLGLEQSAADVECIDLACSILKNLGLADRTRLEINTLGDPETRERHRQKLVEYLSRFANDLSPDSQVRLQRNPLRILDSKDSKDREILKEAPSLADCMTDSSKTFWSEVQEGLTLLGLPYEINDRLVRGIDYYTHTVFEITTQDLGAQSAVIAGGRYNGLIGLMGGPDTPGIGWAAGVERLALLLGEREKQQAGRLFGVASADPSAHAFCFKLTHELRERGIRAEFLAGDQLGKKLKRAVKQACSDVIIVGQNEISSNQVAIKNLKSGDQRILSMDEFWSWSTTN